MDMNLTDAELSALRQARDRFDGHVRAEARGLVYNSLRQLPADPEPEDEPISAGRRSAATPLEHRHPETRHAGGDTGFARAISGPPTYARLFGERAAHDAEGWRDSAEFLRVFALGMQDNRFRAASTESDGASGGFSVPAPLIADIFDRSLGMEIVRPRAKNYPMGSSSLAIAGMDTQDQDTRGTVGGLTMQMLGELATGDDQTPKWRRLMLMSKTGRIYSRASVELVEDSINFAAQLVEGFSAAMSQGVDNQFIRGTGVGQALGVLNSPCLIVQAAETQAADTIVAANVLKMYSRMYPPLINDSIWLVHPSCIPQLFRLSVTFTNVAGSENVGGSLLPIFQQMQNGDFVMLGRPVKVTHLCAPVGDQGDIIFAAWSAYGVGMRRQASIESNRFSGWSQFAEDYRVVIRFDGLPLYSQPISTPDSGDTLSPFVALAARA